MQLSEKRITLAMAYGTVLMAVILAAYACCVDDLSPWMQLLGCILGAAVGALNIRLVNRMSRWESDK